MDEIIEKEIIDIENMIYEIRGLQVMLDSDIAKLYHVETKRINEAVKNNQEKFPERLSFTLTNLEKEFLRSKISTLKNNRGKHSKYLPRVFTEQGIYMLATVLKSKIAAQVTLNIMDTFVLMKKYISNTLIDQKHINNMVLEHDKEIKLLNNSFNKLNKTQKINTIFFDGEIYDAYSLLLDILNQAKNEIIIIDNYAGKELLDILKKVDKKIIIISKNIDDILKKKYESQYSNIEFIDKDIFHDRFIIIDRKKLYSCGASFKDLGKKCFAINEMSSKDILNSLIEKINLNN